MTDRAAFGGFYSRHVEALTGSVNDAKDPDRVAKICYAAAIIYAAFIAFCGMQVSRLVLIRPFAFGFPPPSSNRSHLRDISTILDVDLTVDDGAQSISAWGSAVDWIDGLQGYD